MSFGENLKRLRIANNLTQEQLSTRLGVARSSIAQYESNNIKPPLETILSIRDVLNCSFEQLLGEISEKQKEHIEIISKQKDNLKDLCVKLLKGIDRL